MVNELIGYIYIRVYIYTHIYIYPLMVIFSHVGINIPYIWVNLITTETCSPEPWKSWFILGESSPNGRTFGRLVKYDISKNMGVS